MKRLNTPFFILLFSSLLLAACQDQSVQNDQFQSPPLQNSLTSSSSDYNWTERVQEGRILADKEMNGYSRWDSPWWDLDYYSLSDSIKAVKGHVLIGFKNPEDVSGVDLAGRVVTKKNNIELAKNDLKELGVTKIEKIEMIPAISAVIEVSPELIEQIRNHPLVDYIEPDGNARPLGTYVQKIFDEEFLSQVIPWNVTRVQAPEVWNRTTGNGVVVHIIDTGVTDVEDLFPITRYSNGGGFDDFSDENDGDGHGTLVAGITSALDNHIDQVGIAFDADLWSGRFPEDVSQRISFITDAIGFARSNNTFVVNLSFATEQNSALTDQINGAYNIDGLIIVAASGDAQVSNNVLYPARLNTVIAVASTALNNTQSAFSPTGPEIEISAPGETIVSTSRNGGLSDLIQGTSFAAPHVSGAAALLKSYNPAWTNVEIRNILNESALHLGSSNAFGSGLVQIREAIRIQVSMSGPVTYSSSGMYTWTTTVQKADGPETYSWHKKPQGSSSWQLVGNNSSLSLNLTPSDGSFQLRVTVNDGFDSNEAFKIVDYVHDGDDCPPFELCS